MARSVAQHESSVIFGRNTHRLGPWDQVPGFNLDVMATGLRQLAQVGSELGQLDPIPVVRIGEHVEEGQWIDAKPGVEPSEMDQSKR